MPEPVVIIGPAAGPAGPISGHPGSPAGADGPESRIGPEATEAASPSAARQIVGITGSLLKQVARALATFLIRVIAQYPRHSLAAAASLVILGAILYSQSGSTTTRRDLTNAISGNPSPQAAGPNSPDAGSGARVAADTKTGGSDQEKTASSEPVGPPKPAKTETTTAQTDPAAPADLPAPKPQSTGHDSAAGSLVLAGSPEKDAQKPEAAPASAVSSLDPASVPLPAPVGESAKATLLAAPSMPHDSGSIPPAPPSSVAKDEKNGAATAANGPSSIENAAAPAPSGGDQVAATSPMPEVPSDLLLPESAPKGAEGKTKEGTSAESALAAKPGGESKPLDEPQRALGAAPRPIEPVSNPPGEPIPVPGQVPETPAAVPQNIIEPTPVPANPGAAPSSAAGINQPGDALKPGENAEPHDKPTRKPHEAPTSQTDSGAQPVSTAARAGGNTVKPAGEQALPRASGNGNDAGWISIPNSGKVPVDLTERPVGEPGAGPENGAAPLSTAGDSRFHASRDINFEPEPTQSRRFDAGSSESSGAVRGSGAAAAANQQPRAASHSERVEATEHVVELKENYWTISRQYWGSARYFAALWKANAAKYPDIDRLHVGDVIVVPAIEDLDPDYILPPGKTVTPEWLANLGISRRASPGRRASGDAGSDEEAPPARSATARAAGKVGLASTRSGNVATRRASQSDSDLDLQDSGSGSRVDRSSPYKGRSSAAASTFDGDGAGEETETRTAARPRATKASSASSPVYKVRSNDTLRSIARDTLGDARRADEILELNRGSIDDPGQLVVGQVLELPEDARTGIRRRSGR